VAQATKQFLKVGGILLCNDSHGDATLVRFDEDPPLWSSDWGFFWLNISYIIPYI
jgi:hypothetical protein